MKSTITLCPCESTQISGYGYDHTSQTLALQFKQKNGVSVPYHYANVSPEMLRDFEASPSKGKFFGQHIKNNPDITCTKMIPDPEEQQQEPEAA